MLTQLVGEDVIKMELEGQGKEEIFRELLELLVKAGKIRDHREALKEVMCREHQQTTGIGGGLAIPHGRLDSLDHAVAALGVSKPGIDYHAIDEMPVHVVFLILGGANKPGELLQALADFARCFADCDVVEKLCAATTPCDVVTILKAHQVSCPPPRSR